jgi:uncharacterized protein YutD
MIEIQNREYELIKDYRDAYNLEQFKKRYSEMLDKYDVIVGDIASDMLRLKGFSLKEQNNLSHVSTIPDYLNESCNYNTPYFILKRVK